MSKGSNRRPTDEQKVAENWARTFQPAVPALNCPKCSCLWSLHDGINGCQAQWGGYNDRQFCECEYLNVGNVVPSQWFDDDEM